MQFIESIQKWFSSSPIISNSVEYIVWVALIIVFIQITRKVLRKKVANTTIRYKSQKGIEIIGYVAVLIISISFFTETIKDFTLILGLLSASIAFTLQELILSVAGSIYIFFVKVYTTGDRIEINGIKGDVIDIDSIYTTMMEIGQWVSSDNYTGRIVKLSNAFVFKVPIYNYSQDFPFIWDEFNLPIRYGSDVELTKQIIAKVTTEVLADYTKNSTQKWEDIVNKYYIENAQLEPTLAITLTDNWIQFNVRYIVDYKKRRLTKHILNEKINQEIKNSDGKITLASATFEVVNLSDIKLK